MSSTKHPPIGIDLGTSNSVICVFQDGEAKPIVLPRPLSKKATPLLPSLVGYSKDEDRVYVGHKATEYEDDPDCFVSEIKRYIGTDFKAQLGLEQYSPQEISAHVLKLLGDYVTESVTKTTVTEAIISVPANFKDAQRQATLDAAKIAGIDVPMLIPEPTAAALAFGIDHLEIDELVLVFDFGGGTLDISLLELCEGVIEVKRIDGDSHLGGKDIDDLLLSWVKDKVNQQYPGAQWLITEAALKNLCEEAKIKLSSSSSFIISSPMSLLHNEKKLPLQITLTQDGFKSIIETVLDRAKERLENIFKGDGRSKKRIDKNSVSRILMVGGSTYIPAVRECVTQVMQRPVSNEINPDLAVAVGACIRSAIYTGVIEPEKEIMLADISPFSVGIEIVEIVGERLVPGIFSPLIMQNTPIPTSSTHEYSLMHPEQEEVSIKLFQGNSKYTIDNEMISEAEISEIPPSTTDKPRKLKIDFSFDLSGIVSLVVGLENTNLKAILRADPRQGRLGEDQIQQASSRLQNKGHLSSNISNEQSLELLAEDTPSYSQVKGIIKRAKKVYRKSSDDRVKQVLSDLYNALIADDQAEIEVYDEQLTDLILEIEY
jgi:molecular chaperone DnaK